MEYFYDIFFKTLQDLREIAQGTKENDDENIISKLHCLDMIKEILDDKSSITDDNDVNNLFEFIVENCIPHTNELVREKALACFGLLMTYYYLDQDRELEHIFQAPLDILECVIREDQDQVKLAAVKTGFDIIAFRLKDFDDKSVLGRFSISFLNLLISTIHKSPPYETLYFEGISKLYKQGILLDQEIFNHLVMYYFTPSQLEANISSKQILTCFFHIYPQQSSSSINIFSCSFKSVIEHFLYQEPIEIQRKVFPIIVNFFIESLKPKTEKKKRDM